MIRNPFSILQPFEDRLQTVIFPKEDYPPEDEKVCEALNTTDAIRTNQVHGNRSVIVREATGEKEDADGLITDTPGLAITTYWADCQNFLVFAPQRNVVGVIHAGWKGLLAQTIREHFRLLKDEWDIAPEDTCVCSGPSLCQTCAEFSDPPSELPSIDSRFFDGRLVDLQGIADDQLLSIGVPKEQQERMPVCTRCDSATYWSYRNGDQVERNLLACALVK